MWRTWKLTTYSELVLWTLMANGSVGWNVKATSLRDEDDGGGRPRIPA